MEHREHKEAQREISGWILYDDACGFCRRWVPFWEKTLLKRGFQIDTLQADWVREKIGLKDTELLVDLRLLFPGGHSIQGADVYRYAMKRIWWATPVYVFSILPLGRRIFDWGYRTFARHRYLVSEACNLPGKQESGS